MDERFEKLLQNCFNQLVIAHKDSLLRGSDYINKFALCSNYSFGIIVKILIQSGFDTDLSDFLKVKCSDSYDNYLKVKHILSVVDIMSDAGSTSAQSVS